MSLTAFLLCAGYGSRLRPLTDRVPKPAIPFLGETAFEINVQAISALEPEQWLANAHHLPHVIEALGTALGVRVVVEPKILGTGGCLANAAGVLGDTEHFLVHNADLLHGIDLRKVYETHRASNALATLVGLHRAGAVNTLGVADDGALLGVHGFEGFAGDPEEAKRLTFAGVAFYRRDFLAFAPAGEHDIKPVWKAAQRGGGKIRVVDCTGAGWNDFGTPQGLWDATRYRMEQTGTYAYRYPDDGARPRVANESDLKELPEGLKNVVVYEAPRVPLDPGTTNLLTGRDFDWKVRP
jgi:NDP-sugar pyrophosphorylase family protein